VSLDKVYAQSLDIALAHAYSNHPALFSETIEGKVITEDVAEALSGWEPKIYLDGSLGKRLVTTKVKSKSGDTKSNLPISLGMVIEKKIYDGGKTNQSVRIADAKFSLSQSKLLLIENDILLKGTKSYLNLLKEISLLEIALKNREVISRQLEATKDRYEVGDLTVTDVSQAEARLSDAEANYVRAKSNLDSAQATFYSDIGLEPENIFYPKILPKLPGNLQDLISQVTASNPSIVLANSSRNLAEEELKLALKDMQPSLDLRATVNQSWDPNTFFEEQRYFDVSANISWPLYKGGKEKSLERKYKQKVIQSKIEIDNAIRLATEKAMIIWNKIESLKSQIMAFEASIHANEIALEGVIQEENVGSRTIIDVLDAENELFRARANLIKVNTNLRVTNYELLALAGEMNARSLSLPVENFYNNLEHYNNIKGTSEIK
tara:strand:+ start:3542 stop:4849 length:1308 start_codon:yes stop_codon:yes gene_type:complete